MLEGLTPPVEESICAFMRNAMDQLDKKDMQILLDNLADPRWTHAHLTKALNERGFKCHADQVRHHRTGKCRCA
jgi:hypothetical protein